MQPLLEANLAEHEQVARLDDGTADRYRQIAARVLLLGGSKTPPFITTSLFATLQRVIPDCTTEVIDGLDHFAPDREHPNSSPSDCASSAIAAMQTARPLVLRAHQRSPLTMLRR